MVALQEHFQFISDSGWDRQSLIMLGVLLIALAGWLGYRILRPRPGTPPPQPRKDISTENTLITRVAPAPLPKLEKMLDFLAGDYGEFSEIVRGVLRQTTPQALMANGDLRRSFAHLEALLMRAGQGARKGTLGISTWARITSPEMRRDAKATMLTIIRLLQELEEVREGGSEQMDGLVDRFLEKV